MRRSFTVGQGLWLGVLCLLGVPQSGFAQGSAVPVPRTHDVAWYKDVNATSYWVSPLAELRSGSARWSWDLEELHESPFGGLEGPLPTPGVLKPLMSFLNPNIEPPSESLPAVSGPDSLLAPPKVHDRVAAWLNVIRQELSSAYRVELFVASAQAGTRRWSAPVLLRDDEVQTRLGEGRGSLYSERALRAERVQLGELGWRRVHYDYEISQAHAVPVSRPVLGAIRSGFVGEVTIDPYPSGKAARVTLVASQSEVPAVDDFPLGSSWSSLELPQINEELISCVCSIPFDRSFHRVASVEGPRLYAVWIRLEKLADPVAKASGITGIDLLGVLGPAPQRAWAGERGDPFDFGGIHRAKFLSDVPDAPLDLWADERGLIAFPRAGAMFCETATPGFESLKNWLDELEKRRRDDRVIEFEALELSLSDWERLRGLEGPRGMLARDWRESLEKADVSLRWRRRHAVKSTEGVAFAVSEVQARTFVVDVETISGGSTSVIEEPDPVVATFGSGAILHGTFQRRVGTSEIDIEFDLEEASLLGEVETRPITFPCLVTHEGSERRQHRGTATMNISSPDQSRIVKNYSLRLEIGRTALLASRSSSDGRMSVTLVTVR